MQIPKKTRHIYSETGKTRQVTHWDMDYLPKDEIEALYDPISPPPPPQRRRASRQSTTNVGLMLIVSGTLLLLFSVGLGSLL